jgi:hypothetical protein
MHEKFGRNYGISCARSEAKVENELTRRRRARSQRIAEKLLDLLARDLEGILRFVSELNTGCRFLPVSSIDPPRWDETTAGPMALVSGSGSSAITSRGGGGGGGWGAAGLLLSPHATSNSSTKVAVGRRIMVVRRGPRCACREPR